MPGELSDEQRFDITVSQDIVASLDLQPDRLERTFLDVYKRQPLGYHVFDPAHDFSKDLAVSFQMSFYVYDPRGIYPFGIVYE